MSIYVRATIWCMALAYVIYTALAFLSGSEALRVSASPRMGMAPLAVRVEVRQERDAVAGRDVCIHVSGPAPVGVSCWSSDKPLALVTRWFILGEAGTYQIWARSGAHHSNYAIVEVPREKQ